VGEGAEHYDVHAVDRASHLTILAGGAYWCFFGLGDVNTAIHTDGRQDEQRRPNDKFDNW